MCKSTRPRLPRRAVTAGEVGPDSGLELRQYPVAKEVEETRSVGADLVDIYMAEAGVQIPAYLLDDRFRIRAADDGFGNQVLVHGRCGFGKVRRQQQLDERLPGTPAFGHHSGPSSPLSPSTRAGNVDLGIGRFCLPRRTRGTARSPMNRESGRPVRPHPSGQFRRLFAGVCDQDRRKLVGQRVDPGVLDLVVDSPVIGQPPSQSERITVTASSRRSWRMSTDGQRSPRILLVQVLAAAETEGETSGHKTGGGRCRLGDDRRVDRVVGQVTPVINSIRSVAWDTAPITDQTNGDCPDGRPRVKVVGDGRSRIRLFGSGCMLHEQAGRLFFAGKG